MTHIHIGCIYLTFLHYVFSSASLNGLPEKMHSHTGCNYEPWFRGVIYNAYSNPIPDQMYSHIDHTYLTKIESEILLKQIVPQENLTAKLDGHFLVTSIEKS